MRISDWSSDVCSSDLNRLAHGYNLLFDILDRIKGRLSNAGCLRCFPPFVRKFWKLSYIGSIGNFMSSLAQQITAAGLADHILSERQLGNLLGGGDARRYGLVNRALKAGSLPRVKRGTHLLAKRYRPETIPHD